MVIEPSPRLFHFFRWLGIGAIAISMIGFMVQCGVTPDPSSTTESHTYNDGSTYIYESSTEYFSVCRIAL